MARFTIYLSSTDSAVLDELSGEDTKATTLRAALKLLGRYREAEKAGNRVAIVDGTDKVLAELVVI